MKYNILTVASKSYFPFLDVFINSMFENCDMEKINKIYIVGVDLGEYKTYLKKSDKIVFLDDEAQDNYEGVHSNSWYNTTKLKTEYLKDLLNKIPQDESLLMIDSDTIFLNDISDIINKEYDIQVTKMSAGAHISASGVLILHIACFVIFNNIEKSKSFVDKWIENKQILLSKGKRKPHETPAMNQVLNDKDFIKNIKIESLDDRIVCADNALYPNTKIIHLKSDGTDKKTPIRNFIDRFSKITSYDNDRKNLNFSDYLQNKSYNLWVSEDFNVTKESFYNINKSYIKR